MCHGPETCGDMAAVGLYAVAYINKTFTNTPPVITSPHNITTPEDTTVSVTLTAFDAENDALGFSLARTISPHGTTSLSPDGLLKFVPHPDVSGTDVIEYTVAEVRTDGEPALSAIGNLLITILPVNDPPVLQLFEFGWNVIPPSNIVTVDAAFNPPDNTTYGELEFLLAAYDIDNYDGQRMYDLTIEFKEPQFGTIFYYPQQTPWGMLDQNCTWPWDKRRKPWDILIEAIGSLGGDDGGFRIPNPCGTHLIDMLPGIQWRTTILKYTPPSNFTGTDIIKVCVQKR